MKRSLYIAEVKTEGVRIRNATAPIGSKTMFGHEIIVIGASVGGLDAVSRLIASLPADLPASVFIVLHSAPHGPGLLPHVIRKTSALPVRHAIDGEKILHGRVYVSRPDLHLMVDGNRVCMVRGPKENFHRPSIDALFRTAAESYGPLRRLGERKYHSETVGRNAAARARELEAQSALIRKLLKTYHPD